MLSLAYTRPPAGAVRYGLAACEALVLTTGGLGWVSTYVIAHR